MKLSDTYLPLLLDQNITEYKFSLIFPNGLERSDNDNIVVTGGDGDYYSVILEFNLKDVIDRCIHDVQNMDMQKYDYYIIANKDSRSYIGKRLYDIEQEINKYQVAGFYNDHITKKNKNQNNEFYIKKYIMNKKKYLNFC